ncbi:hypothetical protein ACXYMO_04745 [Arenibacterium sp. CAU 1754]
MSTADSILAKWSEDDRKAIKAAPQVSLEAAVARLSAEKDSLTAKDLACIYMGVLKTTDDDAVLGKLKAAMKQLCGKPLGLGARWFDGLAKAVGRLRQQAKQKLSDIRSATDIDAAQPFADLVKHTVIGIQFANKDAPVLFRTVDGVSRIKRLPEAGVVAIDRLDRDTFASELETSLSFFKDDGEGRRVSEIAPKEVVRHLHTRAHELPVPYLEGITSAPVFGRGGLICEPGYHASEHLYFAPAPGLVVPEVPQNVTEDDLKEAIRLLVQEWLGDYPFDGLTRDELEAAALGGDKDNPPPASLLNFIGACLEQLVRPLIAGPLPMTLIDKPSPRTGASQLAMQAKLISDGNKSTQVLPKGEEEREKRFFADLMEADREAIFDNVTGRVDSPALAKLLTDDKFKGRRLGQSEMVSMPVRKSYRMTGNNPMLTKELAERVSKVRLDARMERPGLRTGFRHPDLDAWVAKNRGKLIWALLVLVRNWYQKGKPPPASPVVWGAYSEYVRVVGGIIHAAAPNWTTWQTNRDALVAESDEDDPIKQLLATWWSSGHRMLTFSAKSGVSLSGLIMADEIELPVRRKGGASEYEYQAVAMGRFLAQQADRVFIIGEHLGTDAPFEVEIERGKHTKDGTQWVIKESKSQRVDGDGAGNVVKANFGGNAAGLETAKFDEAGKVVSIVSPKTGDVLRGQRARMLHSKLQAEQAQQGT